MSEQLKPCPFCGKTAFMQTEHDADDITWHYIGCRSCGSRARGKWHSAGNDCPQLRAEVRDEWNRRADDAALSRLRDTQRVLVEALTAAGQVISWQCFGDCRAFSDKAIPKPDEAVATIRAALASVEEQPFYQTVPADEEATARDAAGAGVVQTPRLPAKLFAVTTALNMCMEANSEAKLPVPMCWDLALYVKRLEDAVAAMQEPKP